MVLLDTSPLLWVLADPEKLSAQAPLIAQSMAEGWPPVAKDEQIRA
jgi:PIN domain nuclease of toxin-antitoxin system